MSLSASEFYEAGMNLPPTVRKGVALRLLESLEVADDEAFDEAWATEIGSRVDDILSGSVKTVPGEDVLARIDARLAAREGARDV